MRWIILLLLLTPALSHAQDMTSLIVRVKEKLDQVNDYEADGKMKTDVAFIKAPLGKVKMYYRKPDRFRLKKDGGISLLPKGGVSVNMSSLISTTEFMALGAGEATVGKVPVKVVKMLPLNDNTDVVLSTLYIDETRLLILRAVTTTRENGTYEIEMSYGKFERYGLPDKVVFTFNTKDYKLPKGLTLEFDDADPVTSEEQKLKRRKGRVEITYNNYIINKGIPDSIFK